MLTFPLNKVGPEYFGLLSFFFTFMCKSYKFELRLSAINSIFTETLTRTDKLAPKQIQKLPKDLINKVSRLK